MWVKFFQAAGVPAAESASYAHIFYENRMELDMLIDLNKEYLREMGITPMGDIISILRHARRVHDQNTRDKIMHNSKVTAATANPAIAPTSPSHKSYTEKGECKRMSFLRTFIANSGCFDFLQIRPTTRAKQRRPASTLHKNRKPNVT